MGFLLSVAGAKGKIILVDEVVKDYGEFVEVGGIRVGGFAKGCVHKIFHAGTLAGCDGEEGAKGYS
jgi:hypothetical protein